MAVTDPADVRLLAALAELGKTAVHELAAKVGMDPREVAYRLVALSGSGLPLLVGVESDPAGLRAAIAAAPPSWQQQQQQQPPPQPPSGPMPVVAPAGRPGLPPAMPTGQGFPAAAPPGAPVPRPGNAPGMPPAPGVPSVHGGPSGPYGVPSGPYRVPTGPYPGPPLDPALSTWGVPQTASWARGDEPRRAGPAEGRHGRIGETLPTQGLEGEQLTVQLLEVQDPADYLFGAAGYRLDAGERAVVVHTEITNRGAVPFASLPDNYLELVTADGATVTKAPVSLTSRPPHKIGVRPGETLGGHTVYVLPDATRVVSVRWSPRPEPDDRTLTWAVEG
ncbi:AsnC family protein [Amycolatopsis rhabdoformis]|uniref:AsnC family protein n=1 Tax=Amycolatopsis rhabdoformis TaxID=1448059 RepID=A0ABZ1IIS1_9PSEU|nr:AsnC family protein [Amycolatopsis rhabdoformis]WSE34349.1 AsnC family protein [Amycolatopsis rhabdoformis]